MANKTKILQPVAQQLYNKHLDLILSLDDNSYFLLNFKLAPCYSEVYNSSCVILLGQHHLTPLKSVLFFNSHSRRLKRN